MNLRLNSSNSPHRKSPTNLVLPTREYQLWLWEILLYSLTQMREDEKTVHSCIINGDDGTLLQRSSGETCGLRSGNYNLKSRKSWHSLCKNKKHSMDQTPYKNIVVYFWFRYTISIFIDFFCQFLVLVKKTLEYSGYYQIDCYDHIEKDLYVYINIWIKRVFMSCYYT